MLLRKNIELIINSLRQLNTYNLESFFAVNFKKTKIGWINSKNKKLLEGLFSLKSRQTLNMNEIILKEPIWYEKIKSFLKIKCNEKCPVFQNQSIKPKKIFNQNEKVCVNQIIKVPRSLLFFFGFPAYGVHCNGWSKEKKQLFFYLSKRSSKLKKYPGLYDNLIGGGQPENLSFKENLYKEGFEEVGVQKSFFRNSKLESIINYCHVKDNLLHSSIIATYDVKVSKGFKFSNNENEVEKIEKFELNETLKLLEEKKLKPNCIIPISDFLIRNQPDTFTNKSLKEIKKYLS